MRCKLYLLVVVLGVFGGGSNSIQAENIQRAGDVVQVLLPVTGLATTFILDDSEGRGQYNVCRI